MDKLYSFNILLLLVDLPSCSESSSATLPTSQKVRGPQKENTPAEKETEEQLFQQTRQGNHRLEERVPEPISHLRQ